MTAQQDVKALVALVKSFENGARAKDMPFASRYQDKLRQFARKKGYIVHEDRGLGKRWYFVKEIE